MAAVTMNAAAIRLAVLLCAAAWIPAQDPPAARDVPRAGRARPNIVFLLTDDQCTFSLGCYGNADVRTPHIDALAKVGLTFDAHYVTTAICMASRASIMTGKFEFRNGCNFEHGALLREHWTKSYPVLLRAAGYRTAIAGKIGFTVAPAPGGKGKLPIADFDAWGASPGQTSYATAQNASIAKYAKEFPHSTRAYGAFGRDFIAKAAHGDRPFCLSISFKAPHKPARPDPAFDAVYAGKSFDKPANYGRQNGAHFSEQSRQGRQYKRFDSWGYRDRYDEVMAVYHQQVHGVDVAVGMILDALREHGVAGNTVVIFTSDNGFLCGSHGYGSKVLPYEESARVPLIIYDPRHDDPRHDDPRHRKTGTARRCAALTGNVDFAPTLLGLAGVAVPPDLDGRDLMPLYDDPTAALHDYLPVMNVWGPAAVHYLAVVTKDAKYVYWPFGEEGFTPTEELYRTAVDRLEMRPLAADPNSRDLLDEMRAHYDATLEEWRRRCAAYHGYARFGTIFDRRLTWKQKQSAGGTATRTGR